MITYTHPHVGLFTDSAHTALRKHLTGDPAIPLSHFVEKLNACATSPEETDNLSKADIRLL